jgi:hypothetical protein
VEQRNRIVPSHICLHAYGNTQVKNLGQLMMDLTFDNGVTIPNQDLLVVEEGISPVIGTNVLFPEDGSATFSINKEKLTANLHGMEIDVVTESAVGKSEGLVHSISIEESSSDQIVRFMIQDCSIFQFLQCQRYRLPLGKGLYCRNQFEEFPVRVLNPYDRDMKLSKDAGRAQVEMFRVYPKNKNPVASNFYRTPYSLRPTMRKILTTVQRFWSRRKMAPGVL